MVHGPLGLVPGRLRPAASWVLAATRASARCTASPTSSMWAPSRAMGSKHVAQQGVRVHRHHGHAVVTARRAWSHRDGRGCHRSTTRVKHAHHQHRRTRIVHRWRQGALSDFAEDHQAKARVLLLGAVPADHESLRPWPARPWHRAHRAPPAPPAHWRAPRSRPGAPAHAATLRGSPPAAAARRRSMYCKNPERSPCTRTPEGSSRGASLPPAERRLQMPVAQRRQRRVFHRGDGVAHAAQLGQGVDPAQQSQDQVAQHIDGEAPAAQNDRCRRSSPAPAPSAPPWQR